MLYRSLIGTVALAAGLTIAVVDAQAFEAMQSTLAAARAAGGTVHGGERVTVAGSEAGYYVRPALVELKEPIEASARETFAPILQARLFKDHARTYIIRLLQGTLVGNADETPG